MLHAEKYFSCIRWKDRGTWGGGYAGPQQTVGSRIAYRRPCAHYIDDLLPFACIIVVFCYWTCAWSRFHQCSSAGYMYCVTSTLDSGNMKNDLIVSWYIFNIHKILVKFKTDNRTVKHTQINIEYYSHRYTVLISWDITNHSISIATSAITNELVDTSSS